MSVVLEVVAPRLLGPALVVAAAIIVKGYGDVGDGFSAGVIVALAISLHYVVLGPERTERTLRILRHARLAAALGLLTALAVGFFPVALGEPPFTHLPRPGDDVVEIGTLELVTGIAFDLGLFVLVAVSLTNLVRELALLVEGTG